ncbi:MAG: hypothetical protein POELPBGB_00423 [Bacteroidia bacterium]|nr:hypothetical protein [Bacteroidia bacterium]
MKQLTAYSLLLAVYVLFSSCEKAEGEGGTSTITGKVYIKEYTQSGNLLAEYYAPEERVYIVYGTGNSFDDDTRTSFDGSFKFQYLNKGNYRVFAYSDCDTCQSGTQAVIKDIEITSNNSVAETGDIIVIRK